jgi:hypothetical protein
MAQKEGADSDEYPTGGAAGTSPLTNLKLRIFQSCSGHVVAIHAE